MSDQASYVVRLIDKVTAPSRKMAASLKALDRAVSRIPFFGRGPERDAGGRFLARTGIAKSLAELDDKIKDWSKGAVLAVGAAGVAIGAATAGMVVKMGQFAESSRLAFKFLYGGAAAGEAAFRTSIRLSGELGQDVEDVTHSFIKLRAAQFTLAESEEVFKLAADLKALTGDAEAATRAVTAITQIKAKGRLQAEELVGQLSEAGVSTVLVYDALGKRLNKTRDQVRALITAGKIDSDTAIAAIKEAVKHKIGVGNLGDFAKAQAQSTLGGALDRLINAPKLFFLRVAKESGPAMKAVKDAVEKVIKAIEGISIPKVVEFVGKFVALIPMLMDLIGEFASGFGEEFTAVLAGMGALDGIAGDQRQIWREMGRVIAQGFGVVLKVVGAVSAALAFLESPLGRVLTFFPRIVSEAVRLQFVIVGALFRVGEVFDGLGRKGSAALGAIKSAMTSFATVFYGAWDRIGTAVLNAHLKLFEAGKQLVQGLIDGMLAQWQALKSAVANLAGGIASTVSSVLQIQSPSRVMRELGEYTAEGFTLGLQSGGGAPGADVAGELASEPSTPFRAAPRSVVQQNRFTITIHAGAGTKARELRTAVEAGIRQALDKSGEYAGA